MDSDFIITLVSTLGFPICCCIALGWYIKQITETYNKQLDDLRKEHADESKKLIEALNNNTLALQLLKEKLEND